MKLGCEEVRQALLEEGPAAEKRTQVAEHLGGCEECRAYVEELRAVEKSFEALPEYDAPDALVAKVAQSVRAEQKAAARFKRAFLVFAVVLLLAPAELTLMQRSPQLALFLALALLAVLLNEVLRRSRLVVASVATAAIALIVIAGKVTMEDARKFRPASAPLETSYNDERISGVAEAILSHVPFVGQTFFNDVSVQDDYDAPRPVTPPTKPQSLGSGVTGQSGFYREQNELQARNKELDPIGKAIAAKRPTTEDLSAQIDGAEEAFKQEQIAGEQREGGFSGGKVRQRLLAGVDTPTDGVPYPTILGGRGKGMGAAAPESSLNAKDLKAADALSSDLVDNSQVIVGRTLTLTEPASGAAPHSRKQIDELSKTSRSLADAELGEVAPEQEADKLAEEKSKADKSADSSSNLRRGDLDLGAAKKTGSVTANFQKGKVNQPLPAHRLDTERGDLAALQYKEAKGYWLNTYVPGDPQLSQLEESLKRLDRSAFEAALGRYPTLHDAARQNVQPFDAPEHAAIGLFLNADHKALSAGKTRMLLQVGLKGTKRHSGIRPPMNVAAVFDLRGGLNAESKAQFRAVAEALAAQKQTGDAFSLIVAGKKGGVLIPAEQFRRGSIAVLLEEAMASAANDGDGVLTPVTALKTAYDLLNNSNNPNAPLGSSEVLYVTSSPQQFYAPTLASMAHEGAVAGIGLSTFALGSGSNSAELMEISRAGQGAERAVTAAEKAADVVAKELAATGKVVARALRLSIRLAPGVHLVDVLGSRRLDESASEQVRRAEQSIDQRVARTTGIIADRGKDEDGIQIVIPAFYADDAHVILLDVVADHPGQIAEVSAKFKDLVFLGNGSAQTSMALAEGDTEVRGGAELNVLKNFLAMRLAATLRSAGGTAQAGNGAEAIRTLNEYLDLLSKVEEAYPALHADREVSGDVRMLQEYAALLQRNSGSREIGISMHLAALKRLRPTDKENHFS